MSKQRNTTMTWRQVKDWLDTISPADLDKRAIVYGVETECFAAVAGCCLATPDEAGEIVWAVPVAMSARVSRSCRFGSQGIHHSRSTHPH